jgi:hypothetical protein
MPPPPMWLPPTLVMLSLCRFCHVSICRASLLICAPTPVLCPNSPYAGPDDDGATDNELLEELQRNLHSEAPPPCHRIWLCSYAAYYACHAALCVHDVVPPTAHTPPIEPLRFAIRRMMPMMLMIQLVLLAALTRKSHVIMLDSVLCVIPLCRCIVVSLIDTR